MEQLQETQAWPCVHALGVRAGNERKAGLETDFLEGAASQRREHGFPISPRVFWMETPHLTRLFSFVCL